MHNEKEGYCRMPIIAEIKLAPGEVGYYDEYSRIYLSSSNPRAVIYAGTNCAQIKRSIRSGRLILVSGGFDIPVEPDVVEQVQQPPKPNIKITTEPENVEIVKDEQPAEEPKEEVNEISPVEEAAPEVREEEVKEEWPAKVENQAKKARRRKTAKTEEKAAE